MRNLATALGITALLMTLSAASCLGPSNHGVPGGASICHPRVEGTVFTIVFENHDYHEVLTPAIPTFHALAEQYGTADAYVTNLHPSLLNYMVMTSGSPHEFDDSDPPASNHRVEGKDHLADQLDAKGVPWRAYMESMGEPCRMIATQDGLYVPNHNPFIYYTSMTNDPDRCKHRVVDFDKHFSEDLAADTYKYMWITPNQCNNMHNCGLETGDKWLKKVVGQIVESPGYKRGGVIFVMFDEGSTRVLGASANLPIIVMSQHLVSEGYSTETRFDHRSYLATIQDIFGMPRLPTTASATPMGEFFAPRTTLKEEPQNALSDRHRW